MGQAEAETRRLSVREAVLKSAQIIYEQTVVDCLVLDVSETGARVRTAAVTSVPKQVTLRFRGGAMFPAVRRWTRGMEIGFSLALNGSLSDVPAELLWRIYEFVRSTTIAEPLRLMKDYRFFDDVALETAAEDAEAAMRRLETMLRARAGVSRRQS